MTNSAISQFDSADGPRRKRPGRRIEDFFARQRTPGELLPDPAPLIQNLTRCIVEILAGTRDLELVARWLEERAYTDLLRAIVQARHDRRNHGALPASPRYRLGRTRIDRPADGVVECVTVVHEPERARAIALRLEGLDGGWRAVRVAVVRPTLR